MGLLKSELEKMKAEGNVEGLIKALEDTNQDIRVLAAEALGDLGDVRAVQSLVDFIRVSREYVERQEKVLGIMNSPSVADPIIRALKKTDKRYREAAERSLKKLRETQNLSPKNVAAEVASGEINKQPPTDLKRDIINFESLEAFNTLIRNKYNLSTHEFQGTIESGKLTSLLEQIEEHILIYWLIEEDKTSEVGRSSVFRSCVKLEVFPKDYPKEKQCYNMPFYGLAQFHNKMHLEYYLKSGRYDKADIGIGDDIIFSRFMFDRKWDNFSSPPTSRNPVKISDLKRLLTERKAELGIP